MLFLNISSDFVHIADLENEEFLARNGIEDTLGPRLLQWCQEVPFDQVYILNGPGGFTNLRVGALTANLMNTLLGLRVDFYSLTKIQLYSYLFEQKILPRYGIIYIGQKNNVRKYDFQDHKYETVSLSQIDSVSECFLDFVHDETYRGNERNLMIDIYVAEQGLLMTYKGKEYLLKLSSLELTPQKTIQPEYFIDPIQ